MSGMQSVLNKKFKKLTKQEEPKEEEPTTRITYSAEASDEWLDPSEQHRRRLKQPSFQPTGKGVPTNRYFPNSRIATDAPPPKVEKLDADLVRYIRYYMAVLWTPEWDEDRLHELAKDCAIYAQQGALRKDRKCIVRGVELNGLMVKALMSVALDKTHVLQGKGNLKLDEGQAELDYVWSLIRRAHILAALERKTV